MKSNYKNRLMKKIPVSVNSLVLCLMLFVSGGLDAQNTYTFTSCGVSGRFGPSQGQVNTAYLLTNLNGSVTSVSGIQNFTVPSTGPYRIDVYGASGGTNTLYSGYGARVAGDVTLTAGSVISVLVGQIGSTYAPGNSDGGGGGSFVASGGTLLFAAGGGGGAAQTATVQNAQTGTTVINGAASQFGSSGAGYNTNGTNFTYGFYTTVAQAFTNGGNGQSGGQAGGWPGNGYGDGGFGGGGSSCSCSTGGGGGGGGYIGGGGGMCCYTSGFGGSSYLTPSALNTSVSVLASLGNGKVILTQLCSPAAMPTNTTPPVNQSICSGGSASLSALGSGTITWYNGPTSTVVIGTGTTFVTPTLVVGNYTYYAAATNTCAQGPKVAITVTVNSSPTLAVSGGTATTCSGSPVNLSASGADTYTWSTGAFTSTIAPTPTVNTSYTVSGTSTLTGCVASMVKSISVYTLPTVVTAGSGSACPGQNTSLAASGGVSYTWQPGNLVGFQVVVNPTVSTVYTVSGIDANGCVNTATASVSVVPCTGILSNANSSSNVKVYPNPNTGEFYVEMNNSSLKTISVTDISGRVIREMKSNNEKTNVNITDLSNGIYYIKIQSENSLKVIKVVKQ